jgi:hypothetical protein
MRFDTMAKHTVQISLRYEGPDVDDGSMSVEDIVPVLQGFASAYGKIAASRNIETQHRLRITGVRKGSADILLEVWDALGKASPQLSSLGVIAGGAVFVVTTIMGVIRLRKHVRRQPFTERISATNSIVVSNAQNVTIEVPVEVFEAFKEGLIDSDLAKMARPLADGKIEAAEITARDAGVDERERITVRDRDLFAAEEVTITTTRETWLTGQFNSLTKSTLGGYFTLLDGTRVFYEYKGDNPDQFPATFAYSGPVRVRCVAHMDENLKPNKLEIFEVERLQGDLLHQLHSESKRE